MESLLSEVVNVKDNFNQWTHCSVKIFVKKI